MNDISFRYATTDAADRILDYMDGLGFTTDKPVDMIEVRNAITNIIGTCKPICRIDDGLNKYSENFYALDNSPVVGNKG